MEKLGHDALELCCHVVDLGPLGGILKLSWARCEVSHPGLCGRG